MNQDVAHLCKTAVNNVGQFQLKNAKGGDLLNHWKNSIATFENARASKLRAAMFEVDDDEGFEA